MIITLLLYIAGGLVGFIAELLPTKQIYPIQLTEGITYFGQQIGRLNFIIPVYELSGIVLFLLNFLSAYYLAILFLMVVNWFRGSGKIEI